MPPQGSAALIAFATVESPAAQPRAFLLGHFMGALMGVSMTKLFSLMHDQETFETHLWLIACLSCATAMLLMTLTNTLHPPAGEKTHCLSSISQRAKRVFRGYVCFSVHYTRSTTTGLVTVTNRHHLVPFDDVRGAYRQ